MQAYVKAQILAIATAQNFDLTTKAGRASLEAYLIAQGDWALVQTGKAPRANAQNAPPPQGGSRGQFNGAASAPGGSAGQGSGQSSSQSSNQSSSTSSSGQTIASNPLLPPPPPTRSQASGGSHH